MGSSFLFSWSHAFFFHLASQSLPSLPRLHSLLIRCGIHQWDPEHAYQVRIHWTGRALGRKRTQCYFYLLEKVLSCFSPPSPVPLSENSLVFWLCCNEISSPSLPLRGRTWYILSLTLCRFLAWNYFARLRLEILQLTRHPENWTLQARWRLVGLPIHLLFLRFYKRDKEELYR